MGIERRRFALLALVCCLLPLASPFAQAATECVAVRGIGPEIARFLDEVGAAQVAGQGKLPLMDVLFGVTGIGAHDQKALDRREPVEVTPKGAAGGGYVNRGPKTITVEGIFAEQETLFRIPELVAGQYTLTPEGVSPDGVTLLYDPAHSVELGESVLGVHFFARIHHTVITREGIAFFLGKNAGPDPDRCYRAAG